MAEKFDRIDQDNELFLKPFTEKENPNGLLEISSFSTLFPSYREAYIKSIWKSVESALNVYGISCSLDLHEGSMSVNTTKKTYDPYMIIKARNFMRLLCRSVPFPKAINVLTENVTCEIIKIKGLCDNRDRFVRRRERLIGPQGSTLKALELLTECFIMVQGNSVSVIGPHDGVSKVIEIVKACMDNVHPIYYIKTMMIKKELAKNDQLKNESWDRFLPRFNSKTHSKSKPKAKKQKKEYTPFPNAPEPRKIDLQMESGEYFLSEREKILKDKKSKAQAVKEKMQQKRMEKAKDYVEVDRDHHEEVEEVSSD